MTTEFQVRFAYAADDGETLIAGLADDQFDTSEYILFQRSLHPSNQDRQLGHDREHIAVNGQESSRYGGVTRAILADGRLTLELEADAAASMGVDQTIVAHLEPSLAGVDEFRAAMARILQGRFQG